MLVLGIESSCDETAAAVVNEKREILGQSLLSQEEHKVFGGVVPEIAARSHLDHIDEIIESCVSKAGIRLEDLDAIAASSGPGLIGGVVVGVMPKLWHLPSTNLSLPSIIWKAMHSAPASPKTLFTLICCFWFPADTVKF